MTKLKKDLSKIKCFKCEKFGHYKSNCPENTKQVNCTNCTKKEENYDLEKRVLYSTLSSELSSKASVIDSRSSWHITGYKEVLGSISEEVNDVVTIGDWELHLEIEVGYFFSSQKSILCTKNQEESNLCYNSWRWWTVK